MKNLYFLIILLSTIKGISQCVTPITFSIQVIPESCNGCCDGSAQIINLSGGCSSPYSVNWMPAGGTSFTATNLCGGTYLVEVMDSQGGACCPSVIQGCNVPSGTATTIYGNILENTLSIFPNPTNSFLNIIDIQNNFKNSTIEIKNYLGKVVFSTSFIKQIDVSNFPPGIYFLTVQNNAIKKTIRIIKQ